MRRPFGSSETIGERRRKMNLRQLMQHTLSIGLFLAVSFLTLPMIAAAQGRIVFMSQRNGLAGIFAMNGDGSNPVQLSNGGGLNVGGDFDPTVRLDGTK